MNDDEGTSSLDVPAEFLWVRPFSEIQNSGLLWLINTSLLHPRGFALALVFETQEGGEPIGWALYGDGTEPWSFADDAQEEFRAVQTLLGGAR